MFYTDILKIAGNVILKNLKPNKKGWSFLKHMGITVSSPLKKTLPKVAPNMGTAIEPIAQKLHRTKSFTPKIFS